MIRGFDDFAAPLLQASPLSDFKDAHVAIEAAYFLDSLLSSHTHKEPLLAALGGLPLSMKEVVTKELDSLKKSGIVPIFIFDGVTIEQGAMPFRKADDAVTANETAWELYNAHQAESAVAAFGKSGAAKVETNFRYFQVLLQEQGIEFMVAPQRACAQLAYLEREAHDYIDAVYGSPETLLWNIEKLIVDIDTNKNEFVWIERSRCLEALNVASPQAFIDACLFTGCNLLPTLPELRRAPPRPDGIRAAFDLVTKSGGGVGVCKTFRDDPEFRDLAYQDRYFKAVMTVKHSIVLTQDGKIQSLESKTSPNNAHEFNGQRLPDELYYYMSKGAVGPRVLGWRASGEILEYPPLDNGRATEYQRLVSEQLVPIKSTALCLLSQSLHRFYQHKDVTLRLWFDRNTERPVSIRDHLDATSAVESWNVTNFKDIKYENKDDPLGFAIHCLSEPNFLANSVTPKPSSQRSRVAQNGTTEVKKEAYALQSKEEVLYNTIWRFLQLREYVDSKHKLTPWGKVLVAASKAAGPDPELQEAVAVATELLRLNLLTSEYIFKEYSHAPIRGSDEDRRNCLLISRVASLGRLQHRSIGYTGPLSRHLLGYHSMTTAVRRNLRDLEDMCFATLLVNGDTDRNRSDLASIALELPFLSDLDCGLSILVKSYLDDLAGQTDPTTPETRQRVREKGPREWLPHSTHFGDDLIKAFKMWDSVYTGIQSADPGLIKDKKMFDDGNAWLNGRRWTQEMEDVYRASE